MNGSGDREIGRSGDRKGEFTAETRSRGEDQKFTTEARRPGGRSGDLLLKMMQTMKAMLREIFDESAYDRFLPAGWTENRGVSSIPVAAGQDYAAWRQL